MESTLALPHLRTLDVSHYTLAVNVYILLQENPIRRYLVGTFIKPSSAIFIRFCKKVDSDAITHAFSGDRLVCLNVRLCRCFRLVYIKASVKLRLPQKNDLPKLPRYRFLTKPHVSDTVTGRAISRGGVN